jgi:uncharacterized protein YcsI (UPF0317 family)
MQERHVPLDYETLKHLSPEELRRLIRAGRYTGHTAGLGDGVLQANLAILPASVALDFMRFCQRNPKPCPLAGVSETGDPFMRTMGTRIDIRTDVPAYNIYRDGAFSESVTDIVDYWSDDMVAFAIGCSFTFEHALAQVGVTLWHIEHNTTVPMFRSSIETVPAGPFGGRMVVSMRNIPADDLDLVIETSRKFPLAHGAPVHWGDPAAIGIEDVNIPDWGDPAPCPDGHIPVFWACGVTPQVALERAALPLVITHKPGHMLVTDIPEAAENPVLQPS